LEKHHSLVYLPLTIPHSPSTAQRASRKGARFFFSPLVILFSAYSKLVTASNPQFVLDSDDEILRRASPTLSVKREARTSE
jgi:hypothetical protein